MKHKVANWHNNQNQNQLTCLEKYEIRLHHISFGNKHSLGTHDAFEFELSFVQCEAQSNDEDIAHLCNSAL